MKTKKNKKREGVGRRKQEEEEEEEEKKEEEYGDSRIRTGMAKVFDPGCKIYTKTFLPLTAMLVANAEWGLRGYSPARC
jgi:hypothetical protein